MSRSRLLPTRAVEKPWGRAELPSPFAADGRKIGEIWFEPPAELPDLLVKYLFTSENLSVQVHPSDAQAPDGSRGKEECWLILDAEPGARIAVGFRGPMSREAMRAAVADGSIEDELQWYSVKPGDVFHLEPGTVHALGAGISLLEIQQNSDITYRLYDYGRARELHLEEGLAVSRGGAIEPSSIRHVAKAGTCAIVEGAYFRADRVEGPVCRAIAEHYAGAPVLVAPLKGVARVGDLVVPPGACALVERLADLALDSGAQAVFVKSCG